MGVSEGVIKYTQIASNIMSPGFKKKLSLAIPNVPGGNCIFIEFGRFFSLCLNIFDHIVWVLGLSERHVLTLRA